MGAYAVAGGMQAQAGCRHIAHTCVYTATPLYKRFFDLHCRKLGFDLAVLLVQLVDVDLLGQQHREARLINGNLLDQILALDARLRRRLEVLEHHIRHLVAERIAVLVQAMYRAAPQHMRRDTTIDTTLAIHRRVCHQPSWGTQRLSTVGTNCKCCAEIHPDDVHTHKVETHVNTCEHTHTHTHACTALSTTHTHTQRHAPPQK